MCVGGFASPCSREKTHGKQTPVKKAGQEQVWDAKRAIFSVDNTFILVFIATSNCFSRRIPIF